MEILLQLLSEPNFLLANAVQLALFIVVALSLNLINGCAGMFSLGHQGFFGVGAYAGAAFAVYALPTSAWAEAGPAGHSLVLGGLGLAGSIAAGALFGLVVGIPCLRLKGDYLAIATLGFAEIFGVIVRTLDISIERFERSWGIAGSRGCDIPRLITKSDRAHETVFNLFYLAVAVLLIVAVAIVIRNIMRSSHGRAIYAIREDEVAAEILGVDLTHYKVVVFVVGAAMAGAAGAVFAHFVGYITHLHFDLMFGVTILAYVILGGLGRMLGCAVATVVLYTQNEALRLFSGQGGIYDVLASWRPVIFPVLLIALVLARPQGILGKKSV